MEHVRHLTLRLVQALPLRATTLGGASDSFCRFQIDGRDRECSLPAKGGENMLLILILVLLILGFGYGGYRVGPGWGYYGGGGISLILTIIVILLLLRVI